MLYFTNTVTPAEDPANRRTNGEGRVRLVAHLIPMIRPEIDVMVNGKSAEVLAAVGFPRAVDGYQVNFYVPPGTAKGPATIQVSAAWITEPAVTITVQ